MPRLTIIVASTRPRRVGRQIADWFAAHARGHGGFDVHIADLAEVDLPLLDEPYEPAERRYQHRHTRDWSATIDTADGFVFVMPEYNNGFTAPLKNAIDYLAHEWRYKPVGFVGYGMSSSGLRAVGMIKQVVTNFPMVPVAETVSISLRDSLDDTGRFQPTDRMAAVATAMLDQLERLGAALEPVRKAAA